MYHSYVLQSEKDGKYYYGSTENVEARLSRHNEGRVTSTKSRRPFKLVGYLSFETRELALKQESEFKKHKNKEYIIKILEKYGAIV